MTQELISGQVKESIKTVLKEICKKAPNAQIMLMGYPKLLESTVCVPGIGFGEMPWLNDMGDWMKTNMGMAATEVWNEIGGPAIEFANPIVPGKYFEGKAVCGGPETIHAIVATLTRGKTGPCPDSSPEDWNLWGQSQQSMHPKITGATIYAEVMQDTVRGRMGL